MEEAIRRWGEKPHAHVIPIGSYENAYPADVTRQQARQRFGIPDEAFAFVFFGNVRPYKGVNALIDAFRHVQSAHPTSHLLIAGRPHSEAFAAEVRILSTTAWRNASLLEATGEPGPEGSTLKLYWSELDQRVKQAAVEILGPSGLVPEGDPLAVDGGLWCHELLWSRAGTIYAGTSEIQRNIIAQRVLGLPR